MFFNNGRADLAGRESEKDAILRNHLVNKELWDASEEQKVQSLFSHR